MDPSLDPDVYGPEPMAKRIDSYIASHRDVADQLSALRLAIREAFLSEKIYDGVVTEIFALEQDAAFRRAIEEGLADIEARRVIPHEEVFARLRERRG